MKETEHLADGQNVSFKNNSLGSYLGGFAHKKGIIATNQRVEELQS